MAKQAITVETQRLQYKAWQEHAGQFGVSAIDFNNQVKSYLDKTSSQPPTPARWVQGSSFIAKQISGGRCCPKAVRVPCVCIAAWSCWDHGTIHNGTHD